MFDSGTGRIPPQASDMSRRSAGTQVEAEGRPDRVDDGRAETTFEVLDAGGLPLPGGTGLRANDPPEDLREGSPPISISIISPQTVVALLKSQLPPSRPGWIRRYGYAYLESRRGALDFAKASDEACSARRLCLVGGRLYNTMDFGNFLWGAAMRALGFRYLTVKVGSELNGALWACRQNGNLPGCRDRTGDYYAGKILWSGDSPADQYAIRQGYRYGARIHGRIFGK
jgi:hypothetical protein